MAIKIHNTLSNKKEEFHPLKKNFVSMYVCGITPYDEVHIGHARAYVFFDIVKRHLIKRRYQVKHVQNFTDVDDKIIKRARERNMKPSEIAQIYINDYFIQTDKLNILKAEKYPRVTQNIPEIVKFIEELKDKGFAYETAGNVYFAVEKFKNYGKLSKRKFKNLASNMKLDKCGIKRSPFDFALWKKTKQDEPSEVTWESPWGKGRPGWHIECSAMSYNLLGDTIDIHGGGQDLIFPHHENEIAQSESKTGKQFVRYWIHNGFVTLNNKEKMSKSLNNFFTLKTVFEKYSPRIVRYYLLTQHYLSPLDFSEIGLKSAKSALQGIDDAYLRLAAVVQKSDVEITDEDLLILQENFLKALDDDFNSEKALPYLHELKNIALKELFTANKERLSQLRKLLGELSETSLGIILPVKRTGDIELEKLLEIRNEARANKNWEESDRLRKIICEKGYKIIDNKDGSSVLVKRL